MQTLGVYDDSEHIEDGVVQVRFYQEEVGNAGHIHQFDWVGLSKGFGTPVGTEIDPYWSAEKGDYLLSADWNSTNSSYALFDDLINGTFTNTDTFVANYSLVVPYVGATSNLVLGANNFSVDNSVLFVDSTNNNVGIGTASPQQELNVEGGWECDWNPVCFRAEYFCYNRRNRIHLLQTIQIS